MKNISISLLLLFFGLSSMHLHAQEPEKFRFQGEDLAPMNQAVRNEFQFNGFTNYWHDIYMHWYSYGNLFKMAIPDVEKSGLESPE